MSSGEKNKLDKKLQAGLETQKLANTEKFFDM
jgi:hypothetical protein